MLTPKSFTGTVQKLESMHLYDPGRRVDAANFHRPVIWARVDKQFVPVEATPQTKTDSRFAIGFPLEQVLFLGLSISPTTLEFLEKPISLT